MRREDAVDSPSCVVKHFHIEKELVHLRVNNPDVSRCQAKHQIDRVVEVVWLNEAKSCEYIRLVPETLGLLARQLTLLVLQLEVLRDSPEVVAAVGDSHELVSIHLGVGVPAALLNSDWDHGLAKDVLVAIHEVPNRKC